MSPRKTHDNSHCYFVPQKARDILNTTVRDTTLKYRIPDTFLSRAALAQQKHARVHISVSIADKPKSHIGTISEFVQATPHEAPAAVSPPSCRTQQAGAAIFAIGTAIHGDAS